MKCKVWLTLICPMPNHQLVRCKRLDGGPHHTARCCRCTLFLTHCVHNVHIVQTVQCAAVVQQQELKPQRRRKNETQLIRETFFLWLWHCFLYVMEIWIPLPHLLSFAPQKKERGAGVRKTKEEDGQKFFLGDWSSWWRLSGEFSLSRKKVLALNKRFSR